MINLYFVASPLQALAANEARERFGQDSKNILWVRKAQNRKRQSHHAHLQKAIEFGTWDEIIYIDQHNFDFKKKYLPLNICLRLFILRYREIGKIFIGEYRSHWMHQAIEILGAESVYLVDDGIITVHIQETYLDKGIYSFIQATNSYISFDDYSSKLKYFRLMLYLIFYRMLGFSGKKKYEVNLFTAYPPRERNNQIVEVNEYRSIKKLVHNLKVVNSYVYYFGTKYSENNYFSLAVEIDFLNRVKMHYDKEKKNIIYVAHRDDADEKVALIRSQLGIKCIKLDLPAELWFVDQGFVPVDISAASSTAVINLSKIYNIESCKFFMLPIEQISEDKKLSTIQTYNFYRELDFDVIDLYK